MGLYEAPWASYHEFYTRPAQSILFGEQYLRHELAYTHQSRFESSQSFQCGHLLLPGRF